jgi:hypothetical protein
MATPEEHGHIVSLDIESTINVTMSYAASVVKGAGMTDAAGPPAHDQGMTEWLSRYAAALEVDAPTAEAIDQILRLAAVAAHATVRQAAPVACWLAAQAAVSLDEALTIAGATEAERAPVQQ